MSDKISDRKITIRGYISAGADPIVWPWVHNNAAVKNQLATMITYSCETLLRLEALGVNANDKMPLDAEAFFSAAEMGDPSDCRRYTPQIVVSDRLHPQLFRQLAEFEQEGRSMAEMNRHIIHLFECWLLSFWARTIGASHTANERAPTSRASTASNLNQHTLDARKASTSPAEQSYRSQPTAMPENEKASVVEAAISKPSRKKEKGSGSNLNRFTET
jgi:hypothetical protein